MTVFKVASHHDINTFFFATLHLAIRLRIHEEYELRFLFPTHIRLVQVEALLGSAYEVIVTVIPVHVSRSIAGGRPSWCPT